MAGPNHSLEATETQRNCKYVQELGRTKAIIKILVLGEDANGMMANAGIMIGEALLCQALGNKGTWLATRSLDYKAKVMMLHGRF